MNNPELEMEFLCGMDTKTESSLTRGQFLRLQHKLQRPTAMMSQSTTLDITVVKPVIGSTIQQEDIRITLEGLEAAQSYCKTNDLATIPLESVLYVKKTPHIGANGRTSRYVNEEYGYRVNLKREEPLVSGNEDVEALLHELASKPKRFRFKKRFTFLTDDKLFRIDLTAVKSSPPRTTSTSFKLSKTLQSAETYELEIEYVGSQEERGIPPLDDFLRRTVTDDGTVVPLIPDKGQGQVATETAYVTPPFDDTPEPKPKPDAEYPRQGLAESTQDALLPLVEGRNVSAEFWKAQHLLWIPQILAKESERDMRLIKVHETHCEYQMRVTDDERAASLAEDPESKFPETILIPHSAFGGIRERLSESERRKKGKVGVTELLKVFGRHIYDTLCLVHDVRFLTPQTTKQRILQEYKDVTKQTRKQTPDYFGPDPVTLTLEELNHENPDSLGQGFVVTDKADGIRAMLFISHTKHGYLLTGKVKRVTTARGTKMVPMKVEDTGLLFHHVLGQWVLDGEYIQHNKDGSRLPSPIFAIFDVYVANHGTSEGLYGDGNVYRLPWVSRTDGVSRSKVLDNFKSSWESEQQPNVHPEEWESTMSLKYKTYYGGKPKKDSTKSLRDSLAMCQIVLDRSAEMNYYTDGLIFLPMYSPVASLDETPVSFIGGRWNRNYKWKPPCDNTIDFRLRIVQDKQENGRMVDRVSFVDIRGVRTKCKQVHLIVGYDEQRDPSYDFMKKIVEDGSRKRPKAFKPYSDTLFQPPDSDVVMGVTHIPIQDGLESDKLICERDGTEIKDGMIVEMSYRAEYPEGCRWHPLRDRPDKSTPQDFLVANNVWETIQHPVTQEYLVDPTEYTALELAVQNYRAHRAREGYYVADERRRPCERPDGPLRSFHNYVKSQLIAKVAATLYASKPTTNKRIAVLDTSVGRGGDIQKYYNCGALSFFLGIDISPDVNQAAGRLAKNPPPQLKGTKKSIRDASKAMFLQYDTSQLLRGGDGYVGTAETQETTRTLLDILYREGKRAIPPNYKGIRAAYSELGNQKFDLVSSQFSLHYYFKSPDTLTGYIQNLSDNCLPGGYFIGTCYDGAKVFTALQETPQMEMVDDAKGLVYQITKRYEIANFEYGTTAEDELYGQTIDVYMSSIGQTIPEYLVNFDLFEAKMNEKGFTRLTSIPGTNRFGQGGFEEILDNLDSLQQSDKSLRQHYRDALKMKMNKPLRALSSLNNWFIFQKNT